MVKIETPEQKKARQVKHGDEILAIQRADGSFAFEPDGRHYRKDDFKVATSFVEPMGLDGATALDITILPAMELLQIGKGKPANSVSWTRVKKAIDFCMSMTRPEGGDFWETPVACGQPVRRGTCRHRQLQGVRAVRRSEIQGKSGLLDAYDPAFHAPVEPEEIPMLYNTKPVLSSSDWYFANWVRDHVQWEVLAVFAQSIANGIRWEEVDPEIDWMKFHRGITNAAIRWMNVHTDDNWRPHNIPETYDRYKEVRSTIVSPIRTMRRRATTAVCLFLLPLSRTTSTTCWAREAEAAKGKK